MKRPCFRTVGYTRKHPREKKNKMGVMREAKGSSLNETRRNEGWSVGKSEEKTRKVGRKKQWHRYREGKRHKIRNKTFKK